MIGILSRFLLGRLVIRPILRCVLLLVSGAMYSIWNNPLPPKVPSPPDPSGETAIARISGEVNNVHQRYDALAEVPL